MSEDTKKLPLARGEGPLKSRGEGVQNIFALQALRKYWPTATATLVLVMLGTIFYTLGQKKIYEAAGTVMFDPTPPRPLGSRVESVVDMGAGNFWSNQEYYETQYQIIRSRQVALTVVRELGLHHDPAFLNNLPDGEEPAADARKEVEPERAAEVVRGRLEVVPVRDSRLATITFRDASPRRAQRILQTVIDTYVDQNLETALASTSNATDWLRGQLDTLKKDLENNELALHQYKKDNDILSLAFDDKVSMLSDEMKHINAELTRARALLQEASARRSVLSSVPEDDPTTIQSTQLLGSPLMHTLRAELQLAIKERDALIGEGKGTNHPAVAAANSKVDAARRAVLKEITNIKMAVDRDVSVVARQVGGLQGMLDKAKDKAHDHNKLEIEYNRLRRQKENTEKLYALVLERTKEADLTQMLRINNISVVDSPLTPTAPVHPRVPLNLAFGLFIGIMLGAGAAIGRGLLDRTLKVPDEVEDELGLPCLGLLPGMEGNDAQKTSHYNRRAKRRRGRRVDQNEGRPELIVHNAPLSSVAEAARTIRTNLMFMSPDKPHKVLLVTSAGPSEGKTTVACCIATAMAQAGQRVALVDCDLRRPRVHRIFGFTSERGVTTALLEDDLEDVVQPTEVPNLAVIPAGPIPPHPAELFHTEKFRALLEEIRDAFDTVIIDSPPVAAVTDPTVLSTLVDGTVLVVRAYKTRKELARHAVRSLTSVGGNVPGVVLNDVDFSKMEYKYSYYYYRRDEYYAADRPSRAGDRDSTPPRMSASA